MKSFKLIIFSSILLGCMVALFSITSCTHDDQVIGQIPDPTYEYGDDIISTNDGWSFDKTHSSVRWESTYLGTSALLTGRFNSFFADVDFDEGVPANTTFSGKVVLSTVNTGEPGRDAGCLLSTFDVETLDTAYLTSKSVELDGSGGYLVTCDFNFHGVEDEVVMKLEYSGTTRFDENSGMRNAPFSVAGLVGTFEFNALSVFGIESSNIADRVVVRVNAQFKKPG